VSSKRRFLSPPDYQQSKEPTMKASVAAKLHNGDEVKHKATGKVCTVLNLTSVPHKTGQAGRKTVGNVCLAILHPTEGYLEVCHKDIK